MQGSSTDYAPKTRQIANYCLLAPSIVRSGDTKRSSASQENTESSTEWFWSPSCLLSNVRLCSSNTRPSCLAKCNSQKSHWLSSGHYTANEGEQRRSLSARTKKRAELVIMLFQFQPPVWSESRLQFGVIDCLQQCLRYFSKILLAVGT